MSVMFVFQMGLLVFYFALLLFSLKITWITLQKFYKAYSQKGLRQALQPFLMYIMVLGSSFFIIMIFPNVIMGLLEILGLPYEWLQPYSMGTCI